MFANSRDIHVLNMPQGRRRYLILIRAGSKPRPSFFCEAPGPERDWDVGVNYYAQPHSDDALRHSADLVWAGGLSKMHGAKLLFEATGLHEAYEGIFFLDEDVELLFE